VYIHGCAGDSAVEFTGKMGMVAGDLIEYLPNVLKEFEK
jgi:NAD(P)H-hydrate repair Nnr-like enzyme with NAD(P)H-hydrate dehydratase domain